MPPPYHIVITRKNQVLLSFLKIRVVVNGKDIYPLSDSRPVKMTVMENNPKVVVTDGYHFTPPVELIYHHLNTYYFKVICVIGDVQLLAGLLLLAVLYLVGFHSDVFILKLLSFTPIIYFLFFYYINRKEFIQITPV
ncbi:MAG: hypothetical protein H7Y42_18350 [Chitinophagaceae bacterium]|nr:hypothetical protein [Chitinophagaceae bacterium]